MALRGTAAHVNGANSTTNAVNVSGISIALNDIVILGAQWVNPAGTAPTLVQHAANNGPGATQQQKATAVFQAFASNTTAGNAIVAFYTCSDFAGIHTDLAAADSASNSYSAVLNQQNTSQTGGSQTVASFVASNIAGGADTVHTYLATNGDSEDFQANYILEVGNVSAAPFVGNSGNTQNALAPGTNNLVSGNITVTASQVPCILVALAFNSSGTVAPTVGTGMTLIGTTWNYGSGPNLATVAYQNITTAGTYQAVFNQADSVTADMGCLAVILQGTPGAQVTFTLPSGFATIPGLSDRIVAGDQTMMALAYKVATASEPASYTVTGSVSALSVVVARVYSGRNTVSPFTAVASTANTTASSPITYALTGVTAAASDDVVEFVGNQFYQGSSPGFTQPPGYSNGRLDSNASITNIPILASCDYQGAPAGLTGTNGGKFTAGSLTGLGYSGQQISLAALNPFILAAAPGAFALTGQAAVLGQGAILNPGAFAFTGQTSLLYVGASGYQLLSAPGSFAFTGANGAEGFELDSIPGAFALTGQDTNLNGSLFITGQPGSFTLNGGFATFSIATGAPLPPMGPLRVVAVSAGFYRGEYYVPGDVFDLLSGDYYSDSTQNYESSAGESAPGWMLAVPLTTPLYQWASATLYPAFPAVDPARRFVL